jgi:hypothetical protein
MRADDLCKPDRFRRRTPRRATGLLALACALHGCGEARSGASARGASDAPVLVPVDSVVLAENDSSYVAGTSGLAVAPDGSFFVADHMAKRVHVFRRDGRFLRSIGRPGRGPGEFDGPSHLAFSGDSLLYVVDWSEIEVFDRRTAGHLGAYRMPRQPNTIAVSAGRLFAGHADAADRGSVARVMSDTTGMQATGPFPELLRDPLLFPMFNSVALGMRGDTAATAFHVTDYLYFSDVSGRVLDSIQVPKRRRNGARPDRLRSLARTPSEDLGAAAFWGSSLPTEVHWTPGGRLVLVSNDRGMVADRWIDSSFVSVVDRKTRRSCVDARVPGPTEPTVSVAFRGDTLFVVSQELTGDTRASTVVRWYRIDTGACRWMTG